MQNIQVNIDEDGLTLQWVAPQNNGNTITSYDITVFLNDEMVYTVTSQSTSLSVSRDQLQDEGDVIRTENTEYVVAIIAENDLGQGEGASTTFLLPSGWSFLQVWVDRLFIMFFYPHRVCCPTRM